MNKIIIISIQLILFIPFYLIWRNDCKKIGKENLAISLKERFFWWLLLFPYWVLVFIN
jgi:hypothetical protein